MALFFCFLNKVKSRLMSNKGLEAIKTPQCAVAGDTRPCSVYCVPVVFSLHPS